MNSFSTGERYYYSLLAKNNKKAYDILVDGLKTHRMEIRLNGLSEAGLNELYEAVNLDYPQLFWPDYYRASFLINPFWIVLKPSYFFDRKESRLLAKEAEEWRKRICSEIPAGCSEMDKIWMLYDYLARQVTYHAGGLQYSNTIIGPMQKGSHRCVCEGVSKAFKYLGEGIGISSIIITGQARPTGQPQGPHAWNMVKINDVYRHIDVTWQIDTAHFKGAAPRKHFLYKDCDMKEYEWNRERFPLCI